MTGIVTDDKKTSLSGVIINVKGQSRSVTTDEQVKFFIIVNNPSKAVLICSYVGYKTAEIKIEDQNSVVINLLPGEEKLDDVVVVGRVWQTKKDKLNRISCFNRRRKIGWRSNNQYFYSIAG